VKAGIQKVVYKVHKSVQEECLSEDTEKWRSLCYRIIHCDVNSNE